MLNVEEFRYKPYTTPTRKRKPSQEYIGTKKPVDLSVNIRSDHSGDEEYNLSQLVTTNLNIHLTRPFEKLESYYRVLNDKGRLLLILT